MRSRSVLMCVSVIPLILSIVALSFGGLDRLVHSRYGSVVVDRMIIDFGAMVAGQTSVQALRITNRGQTCLNIVGCRTGCRCVKVTDIPSSVRSNDDAELVVALTFPSKERLVRDEIVLYTDHPAYFELPVQILAVLDD